MAIRKIARMGHPALRNKNRELTVQEIRSPEIQQLINDMRDTMADYEGIGLAAPQVYENIQLAIIEFDTNNPRYQGVLKKGESFGVFINPKIKILDPELQGFWEGCLSIPEIRGLVYRPKKIEVSYLDVQGKSQTVVAEDFLATVFQHELDHLDSVLFIDRIQYQPGKSPIAFVEEYQRYWAPEENDDIGELED
jgi:peptide deformylase